MPTRMTVEMMAAMPGVREESSVSSLRATVESSPNR
jgi:hypothetical protein